MRKTVQNHATYLCFNFVTFSCGCSAVFAPACLSHILLTRRWVVNRAWFSVHAIHTPTV